MHLFNAIMFFAVAILITAQKSLDGGPLINDWKGLGIAVLILTFNGIINILAWMHKTRRG